MRFPSLVPGLFVQRDNRFRVQVRVKGGVEAAHLPNSGRLGELLTPGRGVWLAPADPSLTPRRRTAYDLALVEFAGRLVSVDARLPEQVVAQALQQGQLTGFEDQSNIQRQVRLGQSRIDFRLDGGQGKPPCWIEVKSVTLVDPHTRTARFPDAPTLRGQRHLRELAGAVENGGRAVALFVVQRDDARQFAPHDTADPAFGLALRQAAQTGVEVVAWRCEVSLEAIQLVGAIPAIL